MRRFSWLSPPLSNLVSAKVSSFSSYHSNTYKRSSSKMPVLGGRTNTIVLSSHKAMSHSVRVRSVAASFMAMVVITYAVFLVSSLRNPQQSDSLLSGHGFEAKTTTGSSRVSHSSGSANQSQQSRQQRFQQCGLRKYPPHRYYHLNGKDQPSFLKEDAMYIYGEWPIVLEASRQSPLASDQTTSVKLCVDQSEWHPSSNNNSPFADGTNPSILSIERLQKHSMYNYLRHELGGSYLATLCMTNSQCAWRDSEEQVRAYNVSRLTAPATVRTILLVLDDQFQTLAQATILLKLDAVYSPRLEVKNKGDNSKLMLLALDDARLFVHHNQLWVSYREGKLFGYDKQVLNEVHILQGKDTASLKASIRASETTTLCCGRNMALMEHAASSLRPSQLQSLTWVDPITVVDVNDGRTNRQQQNQKQRRLQEGGHHHKKERKTKNTVSSHIHGTNAFMVYLSDTDEFLGMGHFHRPADRDANPYARFGHHYTHALFTISAASPYVLKRMSPEFVLPAFYQQNDAEIIQFASGLELVTMGSKNQEQLVIAYGINDCEGAAMYVDLHYVNSLLRPVEPGRQVVDLMRALSP